MSNLWNALHRSNLHLPILGVSEHNYQCVRWFCDRPSSPIPLKAVLVSLLELRTTAQVLRFRFPPPYLWPSSGLPSDLHDQCSPMSQVHSCNFTTIILVWSKVTMVENILSRPAKTQGPVGRKDHYSRRPRKRIGVSSVRTFHKQESRSGLIYCQQWKCMSTKRASHVPLKILQK